MAPQKSLISQTKRMVTSHRLQGTSTSVPSIGDHWKHLLWRQSRLGAQPPRAFLQYLGVGGEIFVLA